MSGWIGVDLDGTLAHGGTPITAIGPPIPAMVERVQAWLAEGREVRIFTARVGACGRRGPEGNVDSDAFALEQRELIAAWCLQHLGRVLTVTATKDFDMEQLFDDRCVQVEPNTGRLIGAE